MKCRNHDDPIVMVDDNEIDLTIAKRVYTLSKLTNPFLSLESGAAFLEYMECVKARRKPLPSIVLMDINMPMMDGFATVEKMRQQSHFSQEPPVIILTNSDNPKDVEKAYSIGANGFQRKQFDISAFTSFFDSLHPESDSNSA